MQFKIVALSLFAATAAAENTTSEDSLSSLVAQLPECALDCFSSSAESAGCSTTDFDCLCGDNKSAFISDIGVCIALGGSCTSSEISNLTTIAGEICQAESTASSADIASASAAVTSVLGTAAAASATATGNAAYRYEMGYGVLGAMGAFAALAL